MTTSQTKGKALKNNDQSGETNLNTLRCERSGTAQNPNDLANCALLAQALSVVSTKKPGSAKFNEPMRTSLAPSQTLCGRAA